MVSTNTFVIREREIRREETASLMTGSSAKLTLLVCHELFGTELRRCVEARLYGIPGMLVVESTLYFFVRITLLGK
jgi:hypothetical protein